MPSIDALIRDLAVATRQADDNLRAAAAPPETHEARLGLALQPGTRVLDLITGQTGVIDGGARTHTIIPATER